MWKNVQLTRSQSQRQWATGARGRAHGGGNQSRVAQNPWLVMNDQFSNNDAYDDNDDINVIVIAKISL